MLLLSVVLFFSGAHGLERQLSYAKNPGCEEYDMALHYVRAEGPNDTLHFIWDFTGKLRPTIFLALTDVDSNISVSCLDYVYGFPNSLNFTRKPQYEFFLIFNQLIEFNDINDTGILTPQTPRISYDTKLFSWVSEGLSVDGNSRFVTLNMVGTKFDKPGEILSGNVSIQLTAFGFENHDSELPRLLHSPNSTQYRISLENLLSNSGYNESRYAIDFVLVSSDERNSSSKIVTRKNLDDENSPGIFSVKSAVHKIDEPTAGSGSLSIYKRLKDNVITHFDELSIQMVDLMTPKAQNQLFRGAFLQWRPIIYTYKVPSLSNSSEVIAYNLTEVKNPNETLANSLAVVYYGYDFDSVLVEQTVVSLGVAEDNFYKKTNFSSWTFLVSYGSPEEEKFSLLVVLVMCIGLGLPALFMLVGGTYMFARRMRRSKDELSLER